MAKPTNETHQLQLFGGRNLPDQLASGEKKAQLSFNLRSAKDNTLTELGKKSYSQLREEYKALGYKGQILTAMVENAMKEQTLDISRAAQSDISKVVDNGGRIERYTKWVNQRGVVTTAAVFKQRPNSAVQLRAKAAELEAQAAEIEAKAKAVSV